MRYTVDTDSGQLESSRPGGVLWPRLASPRLASPRLASPRLASPRLASPHLRLIIHYATGGRAIKEQLWQGGQLNINWSPTDENTSHSSLSGNGGRAYNSNGYGLNRNDYSK